MTGNSLLDRTRGAKSSAVALAFGVLFAFACGAQDERDSAIDAPPPCTPWVIGSLVALPPVAGDRPEYTFVGAEESVYLARNAQSSWMYNGGGSCNCRSSSHTRVCTLYAVAGNGEITAIGEAKGHLAAVDEVNAKLYVSESLSSSFCSGPGCPDFPPSPPTGGAQTWVSIPHALAPTLLEEMPCPGAPMAKSGNAGAYHVALANSVVRVAPDVGAVVVTRSDKPFARCLVTSDDVFFFVTGLGVLHRRSLVDGTDTELAREVAPRAIVSTATTIFVFTASGDIAAFNRATGARGITVGRPPGVSSVWEPIFLAATQDRLFIWWAGSLLVSSGADGSSPTPVGACVPSDVVQEMTTDRAGHVYLRTSSSIYVR